MTDEFPSYKCIDKEFLGSNTVVNHWPERYLNEDGEHVNTAEYFLALLKGGHYVIFDGLSKQHLLRYYNEFAFPWNNRNVSDGERMPETINRAEGKRLMYRKSQSRMSCS